MVHDGDQKPTHHFRRLVGSAAARPGAGAGDHGAVMPETDDARRVAELEADNARLRRLLDMRDAPGELRHRLHSTTALMRSIIRKSARTRCDLDDYVAHLEDRLDAVMRAQTTADLRGNFELRRALTDELNHYAAEEGEGVRLSGPPVYLKPRAGQVFALAIHELAVNSVEHGVLGDAAGRLDVSWTVTSDDADKLLTFIWKETGDTAPDPAGRDGFGTEFLTQALAYELKATTTLAFEPDGLTCTIRFALTERVGEVGPARVC